MEHSSGNEFQKPACAVAPGDVDHGAIQLLARAKAGTPNGRYFYSSFGPRMEPDHRTEEVQRNYLRRQADDSLIALRMAIQAFRLVRASHYKDGYEYKTDSFNFNYGHLFDPVNLHLVVRIYSPEKLHIKLFYLENGKFINTGEYINYTWLSFLGDSLWDVNGDRRKDYVVHSYPLAGCCARDVYDVFLLRRDGAKFTPALSFINPRFSPGEKIVRGMEYGHMPPFYKYKWNGYSVDTLEFIFFSDSGNTVIRRKHNDLAEKGEVLDSLPEEYKRADVGI